MSRDCIAIGVSQFAALRALAKGKPSEPSVAAELQPRSWHCSRSYSHEGITMPDESMTQRHMSEQGIANSRSRQLQCAGAADPRQGAARPLLQMSTGRVGAGGLTLLGLLVAVILGVLFWGLNSPDTPVHSPGGPRAAQSNEPAAGSHSGAPMPGAPRSTRSGNG
jgi:hypothetical protein